MCANESDISTLSLKVDHGYQTIFIPADIENISVITDVFHIRKFTSQFTQICKSTFNHPFIPSSKFYTRIRVIINKFSYDLLRYHMHMIWNYKFPNNILFFKT